MPGRVLVDDRCLYNRGGGIRTYLQQILAHWPGDAGVELVGFRNSWSRARGKIRPGASHDKPEVRLRPLRRLLEATTPSVEFPSDRGARRGMLFRGYRAAFSLQSRLGGYDASFDPNHLPTPTAAPVVATMHDLSVLLHPEWHPASRVARWREYLPAAVRHTTRWITVSEFTKRQMVEHLHIGVEKISVISEAARPAFPEAQSVLTHLQRSCALPPAYLLFVGTLEPRKNLRLLLDAFAQVPQENRRALPLVLAGPAGWGVADYWSGLLNHSLADEVIVTGYVSDKVLAALIRGARALVMPSLYEGFGLPLIEAMAARCPVICSDIEPFREVAGDAATRVDPQDSCKWAQAMQRAGEDSTWCAERARVGVVRAAKFSWANAACGHAQVFEEVIAGA